MCRTLIKKRPSTGPPRPAISDRVRAIERGPDALNPQKNEGIAIGREVRGGGA
jgi:hypothetical protein